MWVCALKSKDLKTWRNKSIHFRRSLLGVLREILTILFLLDFHFFSMNELSLARRYLMNAPCIFNNLFFISNLVVPYDVGVLWNSVATIHHGLVPSLPWWLVAFNLFVCVCVCVWSIIWWQSHYHTVLSSYAHTLKCLRLHFAHMRLRLRSQIVCVSVSANISMNAH